MEKTATYLSVSEPKLLPKPPVERPCFPWNLLNCFWLSRSKKQEIPTKPTTRNSEKKSTFKPILQHHPGNMDPRIDASPYLWPHDSTFDPKTTALVIIDMQKDFCSPDGYLQYQGYDIAPVRAIIPHLQILLTVFRQKGFPIYHTREGHRPDLSTLSSRENARSKNNKTGKGIGDKGPLGRLLIRGEKGHDIIPELAPLPNENIIDKPGRSAFQHTEFKLILNIKGIKNLIICGVTTDVCVTSTMRDANDNNFDCLLVEDATAASEPDLHKSAVEMVKTEGGIFGAVSSTTNILTALGVGREGKKAGSTADLTMFDGNGSPIAPKRTGIVTPEDIKDIRL